jgi:small subunit ribosomal protein S18
MSEEIKETKTETTTTVAASSEATDRGEPRRYPRSTRPTRDGDSPREGSREGSRGDSDERPGKGGYKNKTAKKKVCRFCAEMIPVDYRNTRVLRSFVTERSKIVPARITGTCANHQRELTTAVKRARTLSLLPYTSCHRM